ncbi:Hsp20/alpha crystallin family protein [Salicibibacter kimchii]|uniref:Hsp20/alpha crystallin family protein n=1 Tax=Salicibibacter kimchii TaxID=2099786 RepID=A0A345BVN5_9BACI|nr:Hsp20/alpha crystallin family protein [Salicibibacter kimchii]AXF55016.1 hypothetical protein DT065_02630 [Salicibibacter kimchii]
MQNSFFPVKVFSRWYTNDAGFFGSSLTPAQTKTEEYWIIRFPIPGMRAENVIAYIDTHTLHIRFQQTTEEKQVNEKTGIVFAYQALMECATHTSLPANADPSSYSVVCCNDHVDIYFNILKGDEHE